jgi:hypothetical protein
LPCENAYPDDVVANALKPSAVIIRAPAASQGLGHVKHPALCSSRKILTLSARDTMIRLLRRLHRPAIARRDSTYRRLVPISQICYFFLYHQFFA